MVSDKEVNVGTNFHWVTLDTHRAIIYQQLKDNNIVINMPYDINIGNISISNLITK